MDMTRSMLQPTGLPDDFWGYAFLAANLIRNLVPTKGTEKSISPYQVLTGKVPDVSMIRVFGCAATAKIHDQPKLANRSNDAYPWVRTPGQQHQPEYLPSSELRDLGCY